MEDMRGQKNLKPGWSVGQKQDFTHVIAGFYYTAWSYSEFRILDFFLDILISYHMHYSHQYLLYTSLHMQLNQMSIWLYFINTHYYPRKKTGNEISDEGI